MYELIQIPDTNCYYIQSPAKIGLVKLDDSRVCLIDSGSDKDAGRKVRQHLPSTTPTPTRTISEGTNICRARPAARSTRPASSAPSPGAPSWSLPSCTEAIPARICATNFSWPRKVTPGS